MVRKNHTRNDATEVVSIRFEKDLRQFIRQRANAAGLSQAEFLRQTLVAGMTAESLQKIIAQLESMTDRNDAPSARPGTTAIPDEVLKSVFLSEALLTTIVESRSPDDFYAAQETANKRLRAFKAN